MAKFIQLDEAAKMLGISPEELNEMRSRNEVRGFRDGATWKFKPEEIDKVAEKLKSSAGAGDDGGDSDVGLGEEAPAEGGDSVLVSERELGGSDATSPSTIIGDKAEGAGPDSDIQLADQSGAKKESDIELVADSMVQGSDLTLEGSEIKASEPDKSAAEGSDLGLQFEEMDSLDLEFGDEDVTEAAKPAKAEEEAAGATDLSLTGDSDLSLDDDLTLGDAGGSDVGGGSTIDLSADDDDDDLVLGGTGSDVTIGAGDSGISLADPADSGLSLEDEPLELGGSAIGEESLVLGEDDMISLGDDADPSAATQLKSDDDFLLTPLEDAGGDESESGSQVIALDDSAAGFDQSAATVLEGAGGEGMAMLEEDLSDADTMVGGPGMQPVGAGAASLAGAAQPMPGAIMQPAIPEAPYSVWNVVSMFVCITMLALTGMLMYDVVRQIWSWQGAYPVNSGMMDAIINIFAG